MGSKATVESRKITLTVETEDQRKGEQYSKETNRLGHARNPINPSLRRVPMVGEINPSPRAEAGPGQNCHEGQNGPPEIIDALQAGRDLLNAGTDGTRLFRGVHRRKRQASRQGWLAPVRRKNGFLPPWRCGGTVVVMLAVGRHIEIVRDENPTQGAERFVARPAKHRCERDSLLTHDDSSLGGFGSAIMKSNSHSHSHAMASPLPLQNKKFLRSVRFSAPGRRSSRIVFPLIFTRLHRTKDFIHRLANDSPAISNL